MLVTAHEEPTRATPDGDEPLAVRVPLGDEVPGAGYVVGEGVPLLQELAVLVPLAPHLAAAADVGDGERHSPVQQAQPV